MRKYQVWVLDGWDEGWELYDVYECALAAVAAMNALSDGGYLARLNSYVVGGY